MDQKNSMKLILGSASLYKREELTKAGFIFDVMSADIDEKAIRHDDYYKLPLLLAEAKAEAILPSIKDEAVLIAGDVVVICNGELIEKPESREELHRFADLYEKYPAEVVTGLCVVNTKNGRRVTGTDVSKVIWGPIDRAKLDVIIAQGTVFNAAGFNQEMVDAFALEHDSMDRLRGMPIELLKQLLAEVGYE